jgi:hypothetical protein
VAEHRADFEHKRARCDKLIAETLVFNKVAMSAPASALNRCSPYELLRARGWVLQPAPTPRYELGVCEDGNEQALREFMGRNG